MIFSKNIIDHALLALPGWSPQPAILGISANLIGLIEPNFEKDHEIFKIAQDEQAAWLRMSEMPFTYRPGTLTRGMELVLPLFQSCGKTGRKKDLFQHVNFICTEIYCDEETARRLQLDEYGVGIMYDVQLEFLRLASVLKASSSPPKSAALFN